MQIHVGHVHGGNVLTSLLWQPLGSDAMIVCVSFWDSPTNAVLSALCCTRCTRWYVRGQPEVELQLSLNLCRIDC